MWHWQRCFKLLIRGVVCFCHIFTGDEDGDDPACPAFRLHSLFKKIRDRIRAWVCSGPNGPGWPQLYSSGDLSIISPHKIKHMIKSTYCLVLFAFRFSHLADILSIATYELGQQEQSNQKRAIICRLLYIRKCSNYCEVVIMAKKNSPSTLFEQYNINDVLFKINQFCEKM